METIANALYAQTFEGRWSPDVQQVCDYFGYIAFQSLVQLCLLVATPRYVEP